MKIIKKLSAILFVVLAVLFMGAMRANAVSSCDRAVDVNENTTELKGNYNSKVSWATLDSNTKTITLTDDVKFEQTGFVFNGGNWTLDLNGKYIKATYPITVTGDASLTIVGNGELYTFGYLHAVYFFGPGIQIEKNATVTIRCGDFSIIRDNNRSDNGAAISFDNGGTLNIEEGNLMLTGVTASIDAYYGNVYITGGNIQLLGNYGFDLHGSELEISGGSVTVGGEISFDIYKSTVTVSGGVLNLGASGNDEDINHDGGVIYNKGTGIVTAKSVLGDYTVPAGGTLTVAEGELLKVSGNATLTVAEGATVVNNGIMDFYGTSKIVNNGTFTNNGKIYQDGAEHQHTITTTYSNLEDGTHQKADTCLQCPIVYVEYSTEAHTYEYDGVNHTITESCAYCTHSKEASLSTYLPKTYNGKPQGVTINGSFENINATLYVEYYMIDDAYENVYIGDTVPQNAGRYGAKMVVLFENGGNVTTSMRNMIINPASLKVTAAYLYGKTYDGTTAMDVIGYEVTGIVSGDDVTVTADGGQVDSPNVGKYDMVALTDITLNGEDSKNYTIGATAKVPILNYYGDPEAVSIFPASVYISALEQTVALNGTPDQTKWEVDFYSELVEKHRVESVILTGDTSRSTESGMVYASNAVILDAEGNDVTANYIVNYYSATMTVVCPDHDTFQNGFCTYCGGYQKPTLDPGEDPEWSYDDVYLVSNAGQLFWVAEYVNNVLNEINVKLVADITVPEGMAWTPIMNFYGIFDGNFKTVSGLYVKSESDEVGMFGGGGYSYGIVQNLHLSDSYFEGNSYVGGIAGYYAGSIINCYVDDSVEVKASGSSCGALVGHLAGSVENCFAYNVTAIGYYDSRYSSVTNCFCLTEADDGMGGKTAAQFASGEVAFLLGDAFGQQIGKDAYPIFGGMKVYQAEDGTYNNGTVKFDIDVARMILGNSLEFQFGVVKTKITDKTGYYAVIEKTWADGTTTEKTIPATEWGTAGQYWAIVYDGLAAKEMGDTFYVTIYNADGEAVSNAKEDSVRAYVERAFAGQTAKGKTMMVDMLNYGAAAQAHFNYGTDNLANSQLTDAQKACGTSVTPTMENKQVKGTNYTGSRFILTSSIQVQIGFKGLTDTMYAIYTYTNNEGTLKEIRVEGKDFVASGSSKIGVELSALVYADARALVDITIYNADDTVYGSATDSIESCCVRSNGDLYVALMKFADSAKAYLY